MTILRQFVLKDGYLNFLQKYIKKVIFFIIVNSLKYSNNSIYNEMGFSHIFNFNNEMKKQNIIILTEKILASKNDDRTLSIYFIRISALNKIC